jgi:ABC-type thiamine transport system ATPase subunit
LRDGGAIVLMATHDFDTAQDVVTRSACLDRGRLSWIADGAAPLRERYRHTLQRNADAAGPA